jgi:hypothetical protein
MFRNFISAERYGDKLAAKGEFTGAAAAWHEASVLAEMHVLRSTALTLKIATLPYHELVRDQLTLGAIDPVHRSNARGVTTSCGKIVAGLVAERQAPHDSSREYLRELCGAISEAVILYLGSRHYHQTGNTCLIPASFDEDYGNVTDHDGIHYGFDAVGHTFHRQTSPRPIQVKTSHSKKRYPAGTAVVALADLGHPSWHQNGTSILPSLIARESEGNASPSEKSMITVAQKTLQQIVFSNYPSSQTDSVTLML